MASSGMTAQIDAPDIATPADDVPMHPRQAFEGVVELGGEFGRRCMTVGKRHKHSRHTRQCGSHECKPLLAAVDPRTTGKKAEYRQARLGGRGWEINVEPLPVVGAVRLIEHTLCLLLSQTAEPHDSLDIAIAIGVYQ